MRDATELESREMVFAWPTSGGAWVLRFDQRKKLPRDFEEYIWRWLWMSAVLSKSMTARSMKTQKMLWNWRNRLDFQILCHLNDALETRHALRDLENLTLFLQMNMLHGEITQQPRVNENSSMTSMTTGYHLETCPP